MIKILNFFRIIWKKIEGRILYYYHRFLYNFHTPIAYLEVLKLSAKKGHNEVLVIMPQLIGDVCYAMAYMRAFVEKNNKEGKIVRLLLNEKRKDLIYLYNYQYDVVWLKNKSQGLNRLQWILQRPFCIKFARENGIYSTVPFFFVKINGKVKRDGLDILRNDLLGLPGMPTIDFPNVPVIPISSIPNFDNEKNRIVIINPYSNSVRGFDLSVFEKIAENLKRRGYYVFTNVITGQQPIVGTAALNCSINELYNICKQIPLFVSVRSGIVDFCISSDVNLFILHFNKNKMLLHDFYKVCQLSAWGKMNATEYFYDNDEHILNVFDDYMNKINTRL